MSTNTVILVLSHSIHGMPLFLVTAGCILFLMKVRSGAALAMLIGNLLLIAGAVVSSALTVATMSGTMNHDMRGPLVMAIQGLSLCGGVTFGVGFLIMALKARRRMPERSQPPSMAGVATPSD